MYFSILILAIVIYSYKIRIDDVDNKIFYKFYFPIFLLLFLTFALQYNVGTDYNSYLAGATYDELGKFKLNQFLADREYLFAALVYIAQFVRQPQMIFVLSSLIQNICMAMALKRLKMNKISVFVFLIFYFTLSLSFFNQFNGIRQYIAVQIVFFASMLLFEGKRKRESIFLFIAAVLFHRSAIIMIVAIGVLYLACERFDRIVLSKKVFITLSLLACGIYFIDFNSLILVLAEKLHFFEEYALHAYVTRMSLTNILTKLIKLVVVYYSVFRLNLQRLNSFEKKIYAVGCSSSIVMLLSFSSSLIWRVYLYFDLFLMFPVILFYKYEARRREKAPIILYLTVFLLAKILAFPQGEYLYNSILFM